MAVWRLDPHLKSAQICHQRSVSCQPLTACQLPWCSFWLCPSTGHPWYLGEEMPNYTQTLVFIGVQFSTQSSQLIYFCRQVDTMLHFIFVSTIIKSPERKPCLWGQLCPSMETLCGLLFLYIYQTRWFLTQGN